MMKLTGFVDVELCVRTYLPRHLLKTHTDKESFTQTVYDKVLRNDDIQFY